MKPFFTLLAVGLLFLCSCSPKVSGNLPVIPENHPDYAVIYFYRPSGFVQAPYNVYLNDQVVFRSKNKNKAIVKVDKPGKYEIWGKTETRESIILDVEPGKDYYIQSVVQFGVALWRPLFINVAPETGKTDWNSIK